MTWGPTVIPCEKKPNHTRRHDGRELSELTAFRSNIDRPPKKIASAWIGRRPSVTRVLVGTLHGNLLGLLAVFPVIKAHLSRGFRLPDDRRINQAGTGGARNWLGRVRLP